MARKTKHLSNYLYIFGLLKIFVISFTVHFTWVCQDELWAVCTGQLQAIWPTSQQGILPWLSLIVLIKLKQLKKSR